MMRALQRQRHTVVCYEQDDNWSLTHLLARRPTAIAEFEAQFPDLRYVRYAPGPDLESWLRTELQTCDVVLVHEWNTPAVVTALGRIARQLDLPAWFHDTHYRVVLDPSYRATLELETFYGILAYSPSLAARYRALGFSRVAVWHEAADTTVFYPRQAARTADVVFVGNYGDTDRDAELHDYVFQPRLAHPELSYAIYGARYPHSIVEAFADGLDVQYRDWLANVDVPAVYAGAGIVLHVPRRQYVDQLPGTPTIRMFEALACGACLVSLPWPDTDRLFTAGEDYAVVASPAEMVEIIGWLATDHAAAAEFGRRGLATIRARHTCDHRASELLELVARAR
jgi:spore maturation protein CgeB